MFHSFVYRRACVSHDLAVNTKGGLINCTGSVLLDAFPSCYSPVGHIMHVANFMYFCSGDALPNFLVYIFASFLLTVSGHSLLLGSLISG